ncbi:MAG: CDP-alcohol phosphatidyltransferase family protein [Lachnospiraceae bacterium]|nr:CDP-alcohol phosphatidyltransferase family protein [Lachnospiraceae bacterium]
MKKIPLIGVFDYTVVVTYMSLVISLVGMSLAIEGSFRSAVFCLALSGVCDMFDGKIARSKKNRTDREKAFGIQIDSLCDSICFGIFPAMICYLMGVRGLLGWMCISYYSICGVIRLAYFNVLESERQHMEDGENRYFHGVPITSIAIILPMVFLIHMVLDDKVFLILLYAMLLIVGSLFILDIRVKKPSIITLVLMVLLGWVAVFMVVMYSKLRVPKMHFPQTPFHDWFVKYFISG